MEIWVEKSDECSEIIELFYGNLDNMKADRNSDKVSLVWCGRIGVHEKEPGEVIGKEEASAAVKT